MCAEQHHQRLHQGGHGDGARGGLHSVHHQGVCLLLWCLCSCVHAFVLLCLVSVHHQGVCACFLCVCSCVCPPSRCVVHASCVCSCVKAFVCALVYKTLTNPLPNTHTHTQGNVAATRTLLKAWEKNLMFDRKEGKVCVVLLCVFVLALHFALVLCLHVCVKVHKSCTCICHNTAHAFALLQCLFAHVLTHCVHCRPTPSRS